MWRTKDDKHDELRSCASLGGLGREDIRRLGRVAEVVEAAAGSVLHEVGEPAACWWLVLDGVVATERDGVTALIGAGDGWGADAALRHGPTNSRAVALSPVRCLVVARMHVEALLHDVPELAIKLLRHRRLGAAA